ncbi:MAG: stage 0 sporulation protein J, partial [Ruminococcus sp.]|nr:stage 0 sporulation protein J [Ruminococcus sp.]
LTLPESVLDMIEKGDLSVGHAKALLGFEDRELLISIAEKASNGGMTVRQVENAVKKSEESVTDKSADRRIDNYFVEMEISLNQKLGRRVKVDYGKSKGTLILEFYDKNDLAEIAEKLARDE